MVSPIAHTFAGFWSFLLMVGHPETRLTTLCRQFLTELGALVLLANLADVDFLIGGAAEGKANTLHCGFKHSFGAAVLAALAVSCAGQIVPGSWHTAIFCFAAYGLHLLIDLCIGAGSDGTPAVLAFRFWALGKRIRLTLNMVVGVSHKDLSALSARKLLSRVLMNY